MHKAKVVGAGSYTPETILTNSDLEKVVDTSDYWITRRTGIKERRISPPAGMLTSETWPPSGRPPGPGAIRRPGPGARIWTWWWWAP